MIEIFNVLLTDLQFVLSVKFPSSSSEPCLLGALLFTREPAAEETPDSRRA